MFLAMGFLGCRGEESFGACHDFPVSVEEDILGTSLPSGKTGELPMCVVVSLCEPQGYPLIGIEQRYDWLRTRPITANQRAVTGPALSVGAGVGHKAPPASGEVVTYLGHEDEDIRDIIRYSYLPPLFWTRASPNSVAVASTMDLPVIDLAIFLQEPRSSPRFQQECQRAADALITYGALILHDPRVSEDDNSAFLDLLEDYFAQPDDILRRDERPELGYQIGVTLENTERPKCAVDENCLDVIARLDPDERPVDISAHDPDPKCRFFWRMAEEPGETEFPGLNAPNVVPQTEGIKERWEPVMNRWGTAMKNA